MKKTKRNLAESGVKPSAPESSVVWWPWAVAVAALIIAFEAFSPGLNAPFVMDDLYLPFARPTAAAITLAGWLNSPRPLLYLSYFFNYQMSGTETFSYHALSVLLHVIVSALVGLVAYRILGLAKVNEGRAPLSVFAGAVFLLHPLATESVIYIASRSEVLSTGFFMAGLALFLSDPETPLSWARSIGIFVLFLAALASKEHTIVLPVLLVIADRFWGLGGLKRNGVLYGLLAAAGLAGGLFFLRTLLSATTAGFHIQGVTPAGYFFSQCRVLWRYVRLFLLPVGQNFDPDIAYSAGPLDHGAIFGLLSLAAVGVLAWVYRKQFPLAAFGVATWLLLIAPTSLVPLQDLMAERRVYLPFLGLLLICIEFLRRMKPSAIGGMTAVVALVLAVLTYQRSNVWSDSIRLWEDTVAKSPEKWRPRFQLASQYYQAGNCEQAAQAYDAASKRGPTDVPMLLNWGLALDCANHPQEALDKVIEASKREHTAHIMSQVGMLYAKQRKLPEATAALAEAEKLDPKFVMTYVYRGGVLELGGDRAAAVEQYKRALQIDPSNQPARDGLARASQ